MLKDLLAHDLRVVFCGSAAGTRSAKLKQYYAGPGNRFWRTLADTGLTSTELRPSEHTRLLEFGIGLTDLIKGQAGMDKKIRFDKAAVERLRRKILRYQPRCLAFTSKRSAMEFYGVKSMNFGEYLERIGDTRVVVLPSPSGAARASWNLHPWRALAALVQERAK